METLTNNLEALRAKRMEEIRRKAEEIRAKKQEEYINSDKFTQRILFDEDVQKLDAYIELIKERYSGKIYNGRKPSIVYGFGTIPNKIVTIVKSIYFMKEDDKKDLIQLTGINEQIMEDLIKAFGSMAYYSKSAGAVQPEVPMDIQRTKELIKEIAEILGLVSDIDLSSFEQSYVDSLYLKARRTAEDLAENTEKHASTDDEEDIDFDE